MKVIGHRGALGHAPENTLKSMQKALDLGVDMVEFDVFTLPTGEIVLMHDLTVDRTTNGGGWTHSHIFEDLRLLDAGEGEVVPTLHEVLDLIDGRIPVNIELKGHGSAIPVAKVIREYATRPQWTNGHFVVSSFIHPELAIFKQYAPELQIAVLEGGLPLTLAAHAQEMGAVAVNPNFEFINSDFVNDAHQRGLKVWVHTVNELRILHYLRKIGVDGVFTNYPDRIKAALRAPRQVVVQG